MDRLCSAGMQIPSATHAMGRQCWACFMGREQRSSEGLALGTLQGWMLRLLDSGLLSRWQGQSLERDLGVPAAPWPWWLGACCFPKGLCCLEGRREQQAAAAGWGTPPELLPCVPHPTAEEHSASFMYQLPELLQGHTG